MRKPNEQLIDSYDYLANAASAHDCTGLIPGEVQDVDELEAYNEIYHYRPPQIKKQQK